MIDATANQTRCQLHTPRGNCELALQLLGRHNVVNAVAASAVALEAGVELAAVQQGLAAVRPVPGRLQPRAGLAGSVVLDDTYNASPHAFNAAIEVLLEFPGQHILVAGDMKELGADSAAAHTQLGEFARQAGVEQLWAIGAESTRTVAGFGAGGQHFADKKTMQAACRAASKRGVVFLIKGSRGAADGRRCTSTEAGCSRRPANSTETSRALNRSDQQPTTEATDQLQHATA